MPQEIDVNGEIIEFPDGMSDAEIEGILQREFAPQAAAPGKPTNMDTLKSMGRSFAGVGEGVLNIATGALAQIPAGVAGSIALPAGMDPAAEAVRRTADAFTYQPRTQAGKEVADVFAKPFQALEEGADRAAGFLGAPGGPVLQTGLKTAMLGIPAVLGMRGGIKQKPPSLRQRVAQEAQAEGYAVPTSDVNPGGARATVEGMVGKPRLRQEAAYQNQLVTNKLAARELGLPETAEITLDTLDAVRREAGQAYSVLDNAGEITPSILYKRDLSQAVSDLKKASIDFDVLAKADSPVSEVLAMRKGLDQPSFDASSVVTATKILRDKATESYRNNQPTVGKAYRALSKALEDAAEAHLVKTGDAAAVQAFREARVRIAKSYTVENALKGDNIVSATKLAAMRHKREPLTGGLDLAARFAEQFPKSARVVTEAPIKVGIIPALTAAASMGLGGPAGIPVAALALGGPAVRAALLSRFGQGTLGKPKTGLTGVPQAELGLLGSGALSDQQ